MIILLVGTPVYTIPWWPHAALKKHIRREFAHLDGYCDLSHERRVSHSYRLVVTAIMFTWDWGVWSRSARAINGFSQIMGFDSSQLLIRELRIPGDLDIWAASKANWMPLGMGNAINRLVADRVISREFKRIKSEALRLTEQVALLQGVSDNMTGLGFKAG